MSSKEQYVWYASYGSNLRMERFMTYIQGGVPPGSSKYHRGSVDKSHPKKIHVTKIPNAQLYFAKNSVTWKGGGVCFIWLHQQHHSTIIDISSLPSSSTPIPSSSSLSSSSSSSSSSLVTTTTSSSSSSKSSSTSLVTTTSSSSSSSSSSYLSKTSSLSSSSSPPPKFSSSNILDSPQSGMIKSIESHQFEDVYLRMYLITQEQFVDVIAQENGMKNTPLELFHEFETMRKELNKMAAETRQLPTFLKSKYFNGWYDALVYLGDYENHPIYTFTSSNPLHHEIQSPSDHYLKTILHGLLESGHVSDIDDCIKYLKTKAGVKGFIDELKLLNLVKQITNK